MPFPKTWLEELVAEYLELEDYFVETGVPVQIGTPGRREIDILATKVDPIISKLHIMHIETGREQSKDKVSRKINKQFFNPYVIKYLEKRFGTPDCERWFVNDTYSENSKVWKQLKETFEAKKVRLLTFIEFIEETKRSISRWKEIHRKPKGEPPMLPKNLWLLKFLEKLSDFGLI